MKSKLFTAYHDDENETINVNSNGVVDYRYVFIACSVIMNNIMEATGVSQEDLFQMLEEQLKSNVEQQTNIQA
nr:MAG TPA: hypothetical protein [Caudoviricetes sp.]